MYNKCIQVRTKKIFIKKERDGYLKNDNVEKISIQANDVQSETKILTNGNHHKQLSARKQEMQ